MARQHPAPKFGSDFEQASQYTNTPTVLLLLQNCRVEHALSLTVCTGRKFGGHQATVTYAEDDKVRVTQLRQKFVTLIFIKHFSTPSCVNFLIFFEWL